MRSAPRPGKAIAALGAALAACALLASAAQAWPVYIDVNEANRIAVVDSATDQLTGTSFETAPVPQRLAITPDGSQLFLSHTGHNFVTVLDTATGHQLGGPIPVGEAPSGIAITPDGRFAYVADNNSSQVSVIDTKTREVVKTIDGLEIPPDVAIAPDGKRAYVANASGGSVSVIDTATNELVGSPIEVGGDPQALAFTPDGRYLFVIGAAHEKVVVIDPALGIVVGEPISAGTLPFSIAITPDGSTAYVTNFGSKNVTAIDVATKTVAKTIEVGRLPSGVAVTPDGKSAYVTDDSFEEQVSVIDPATNEVRKTIEAVGHQPEAAVVAPDQPPRASFTVAPAQPRPGQPVAFSAAGSSDPDGPIASYAWSFGDGSKASGPAQSHVFAAPGSYAVTVTEADAIGCSTAGVYTGHVLSCNGGPGATHSQIVTVANPVPGAAARRSVRVVCPKRALKHPGCRVKLAVVKRFQQKAKSRPPKPRFVFETAVAKVKLAPGASKLVPIVPKAAFAVALASAPKALVREVLAFKTKAGAKHLVKLSPKLLR